MVTIAVELKTPQPAQPKSHAVTLYILYALQAGCLAVQLFYKASLHGLAHLRNALTPTAESARRPALRADANGGERTQTGSSSGTTEARVPGQPAAQRRTGSSSGTTEARVPGRPAAQRGTGTAEAFSATKRGCWHMRIITLVALSVLPSALAMPNFPTANSPSVDEDTGQLLHTTRS